MEDARAVLARRVRELREERGLTQDQLATAAGEMSRVYLSALERGEKSAGLETLQRLAGGLGVEVVDLLRDVPAASRARTRRNPEERLGGIVAALARGADAKMIRKFERLAKVFFANE